MSLKSSCPTRWKSMLHMIDSILQLKDAVNLLKQIGNAELCLHNDEFDFLTKLSSFLRPFEEFADLFSRSESSLSLIPTMKSRIKRNCIVKTNDNENIKIIKAAVLAKVDARFPDSDYVKLHQVLDLETKSFVSSHEATAFFNSAFQDAYKRKLNAFQLKVHGAKDED